VVSGALMVEKAIKKNDKIVKQQFPVYFVLKVLTNQPLNDILSNRDSSGRISKWAMELSEYILDFEKRGTIKSQVLANFVAE
jgi:hypothetical protein